MMKTCWTLHFDPCQHEGIFWCDSTVTEKSSPWGNPFGGLSPWGVQLGGRAGAERAETFLVHNQSWFHFVSPGNASLQISALTPCTSANIENHYKTISKNVCSIGPYPLELQ